MASHAVYNEIAYAFRMLFFRVPSSRASTEQRSDFELYKAVLLEAWAATQPSSAAQALQLAAKARREAQAVAADY